METNGLLGRMGKGRSGPSLGDRRTSMLIAVVSAVLAGVLIYLFVSHYNKTSTSTPVAPAQATVFVAKRYIPAGVPESTVASEGLLKSEQIPATQAVLGAVADPAVLAGQVSAAPIAAGQQVTATDFSHATPTISAYLTGDERAVAFSLDATHGLTAYLQAGSTVDVMALSGGKAEMLAQNVNVIANANGDVILRLSDKQALQLSSATGVSSLWLTLRPASGAKDSVKVGTVENS
jgi:Flp pilus assembly protein CpaB